MMRYIPQGVREAALYLSLGFGLLGIGDGSYRFIGTDASRYFFDAWGVGAQTAISIEHPRGDDEDAAVHAFATAAVGLGLLGATALQRKNYSTLDSKMNEK